MCGPRQGGAPVLPLGWDLALRRGTPAQALSLSWQSASVPDALCYEDRDCPPGEPIAAGNGEAWSGQGWGLGRGWSWEVPGTILVPLALQE